MQSCLIALATDAARLVPALDLSNALRLAGAGSGVAHSPMPNELIEVTMALSFSFIAAIARL